MGPGPWLDSQGLALMQLADAFWSNQNRVGPGNPLSSTVALHFIYLERPGTFPKGFLSHPEFATSNCNMVAISTVRGHNSSITRLYGPSLVAVFVGGTSGIGETTARAFVQNTQSPRVYLIGRDQKRASEIIEDLRRVNPQGRVHFIKTDVSLLGEVDDTCRIIQQKESKVNLLFLSPGVGTTSGRNETKEGLDKKLSLHYYARMRFVANFLPELTRAGEAETASGSKTGLSRVVSVLEAGSESSLQLDDLSLKTHYSLRNCAKHSITMNSVSMEHLAQSYPHVSFMHCFPGIVRTRLMRDMGTMGKLGIESLLLLAKPWEIPFVESGERHLYAATSPHFSPRARMGTRDAAQGSDGNPGSGFYRVASDGSTYKTSKIMQQYREDGTRSLIWEHALETFASVCGGQKHGTKAIL
ncbi:unnamed protein product [Penicillium salamii]|nr:unnamed protein product [Penicillium salamii]